MDTILEDYIDKTLFLQSFAKLNEDVETVLGDIIEKGDGYIIRKVILDPNKKLGDKPVETKYAYNDKGEYFGGEREVKFLIKKRGIKPELSDPKHRVCSIGFSKKDGKWYGWSHRAIYGFKVGDKVKKGDCVASSGYTDEWIKDHPEDDRTVPVGFVVKTEADAKRMAIAFADSVS